MGFKKAMKAWNGLPKNPIDKKGRAFEIPLSDGGRRWAIGDIHGSLESFLTLLDRIELSKQDQLFLLGDLINRGPYSALVMDKVISLWEEGYQVYPLLGNHEEIFLSTYHAGEGEWKSFLSRQCALQFAQVSTKRIAKYVAFMEVLPHYYRSGDDLLVHAGFNTACEKPLKKWKSMNWIRSFVFDETALGAKRVIHGHVPVSRKTIAKSIKTNQNSLSLDSACVRSQIPYYGMLTALELNSGQCIQVKNCDTQLAQ